MNFSSFKKYIPSFLWLFYMYRKETGNWLNYFKPKLLSEKTQILKLLQESHVDRRIGDKLLVKELISEVAGEKYILPTLLSSNNVDEIDFNKLEFPVIIKTRHSSGDFKIIHNKSDFNKDVLNKHFTPILSRNFYVRAREWQYKHAYPGLIVENLILDSNFKLPNDFKVVCINGKPEFIYVSIDREGINKRAIFDIQWRNMDACWTRYYKNCEEKKFTGFMEKPIFLDELLEVAAKFASITNLIRIDFLASENSIYINELTLHHGSGFDMFSPKMFEIFYGHYLIANH
jgi:TupA-like ATPgrasp